MHVASPSGKSRAPASRSPKNKALRPSVVGGGNKLVRTSSAEQISLYIRSLIFEGELLPGTRVPQDAIAQELGVSRIPIREALIALEREGWVTIEMHRGAFINALDQQAIRDHYELLGLIYGFAAKRAISRSDGDLVGRLTDIQTRFTNATDPEELQDLSISFYSSIVRAAASPRITVALRAMSALVPGNFFELVPGAVDVEKKGLAAMVRALQKNDGERASAECVKMMRRLGSQVTLVFEERSLFGPRDDSLTG
jgi:DNA-binding GntR family transcriptional regulator